MRLPSEVMRPERMGAAFPTRLSFMRSLVRRLHREQWQIESTAFELDDQGYGHAIYAARGPHRTYSLMVFSNPLRDDQRTDRVIAESWDACFVLFDGLPTSAEVKRLAVQAPRQEGGRFCPSDLILSRANRSVRLYEHVRDALAEGRQPDIARLAEVGYLMRTTAVYGNGKFGTCDRERLTDRPEFAGPFQAEMLIVYLIRCFTLDHVEHVARCQSPDTFVPMASENKRFLGIGNATGLGMAPFLITHPELIHYWANTREMALQKVRSMQWAQGELRQRFYELLQRVKRHVADWCVADEVQRRRIDELSSDLVRLCAWVNGETSPLERETPWNAVYCWAVTEASIECQELVVSLLIELYPDEIDPLEKCLATDARTPLDGSMQIGTLRNVIEQAYAWTFESDFNDRDANTYFWYYSEDKMEPRLGLRDNEAGTEREMPIAVARDVQRLYHCLSSFSTVTPVATLLMQYPVHRHTVGRVQAIAQYPYGEVQANLIALGSRPIDLLRWKLAFFGASKFDPKSNLWTRITLYQGAPFPCDLSQVDADDWCFPVRPRVA